VRFRPCIDIHQGKVKQIVGSTLRDDASGNRRARPLPRPLRARLPVVRVRTVRPPLARRRQRAGAWAHACEIALIPVAGGSRMGARVRRPGTSL
jgi:phosphoribosylformimino-5-aminoimidazole carboxamide ribonucleotide (ProFAR) isomerase